MLEIRCCFVELCVLYLLVQVAPGTEIVTKSVCSGDSVPMFEIDKKDAAVSLYMNHERHTLMAIWHMENSTIISRIQEEYKEKVFLDEYRTIWIRNVNHWDEENYFIEYDIGTFTTKSELKLHVRVAPNRNCKPKIIHLGKILIASLEVEDCGIPVASLQWLDYPGLSNTSEPVIDLPPGKEAGTYYACIRGPALECAKISTLSDYCSSYTVGGNDIPIQSSDMSDLNIANCAIVSMTLVIVSVHFSLVVITWAQKIRRQKNLNRREAKPLLQDRDPRIKYFKDLNRRQTKTSLDDREPGINEFEIFDPEQTMPSQDNRQLWIEHFDDLKWKDIMALLNTGQKQGLQIYCEDLNRRQTKTSLDDREPGINEFETLNQRQTKPLPEDPEPRINEFRNLLTVQENKKDRDSLSYPLLPMALYPLCTSQAGVEDEKISDCEDGKMKENLKWMKRTGGHKMILRNVYNFFYEGIPFDPNDLE